MKKLSIMFFTAVFFIAGGIMFYPGQVEATEYSLSMDVHNKYILPGSGAVTYEDAVLQTNLRAEFENGLYLGVMGSAGLRGRDNSLGGDEIDLTAGWKTQAFGLNMDMGLTYLNYIDMGNRSVVSDALMPYLEVSKDYKLTSTQSINPYIRHEQVFVTDGDGNGSYSYLGVRHTWSPEMIARLSLRSDFAIAYDSGAYGDEEGFNALYTGRADYKLTSHLVVSPLIVKVGAPLSGIDGRNTNASVGAGLAYNF